VAIGQYTSGATHEESSAEDIDLKRWSGSAYCKRGHFLFVHLWLALRIDGHKNGLSGGSIPKPYEYVPGIHVV
jgi:hypothetical protein